MTFVTWDTVVARYVCSGPLKRRYGVYWRAMREAKIPKDRRSNDMEASRD
jgi:hypothetical protein